MSIRKAFVYDEILRRRKRVGPLGIILTAVLVMLVVGIGALGWHALTQNPTSLAAARPGEVIVPGTLSINHVLVNPSAMATVMASSSTPAASSHHPSSWTVWKAKDPLGQDIWDAPPEIKQWVVQDYLAALAWNDAHMFDPQFLLQHLDEYYTGKRLAEMREIIQWEIRNNRVIAISSVKRLPVGILVGTFSSDGLSATLLDYNAAGQGQSFDLRTHEPLPGNPYPDTMHMLQLGYDAKARRWKIAHALMDYDLDATQIIWKEEWDHAQ